MEKIFEIRMEVDACQSLDELKTLHVEINKGYEQMLARIADLFKDQKLEDVKKQIEEATYIEKVIEEISARESQIKGLTRN